MKNYFLLSLVALSFTISCDKSSESFYVQQEQSNDLTADEIKALSWYNSDPHISADEAIGTAQSIIDFLDQGHQTKAAAPRTISGFKPVTRARMTKAGEDKNPDTVAYVFNFGQDEGYTILSADRRTDNIFALVPDGHIDFQEEADEGILASGLMSFYGNLEAAYDRQVKYAEQMQDSLVRSAMAKIEAEGGAIGTKAGNGQIVAYGDPEYHVVVAPMISVRWGQTNPYNLYTPVIQGKQSPTGCAATAVAQLMSYWRYPTSYNWNVMMPPSGNESLTTFQTISHLMSDVGTALNMQYGKDQSTAYFGDIPGYLNSLGYNPGSYLAYNTSDVRQSLNNHRPVLMAGHSIKKDVYKKYLIFWEKYSHTYYEGGHAWLIDGYLQICTPVYIYMNGSITTNYYISNTLVHCNWGWPELGIDGYYYEGSFDSNSGPVTRAHTDTFGTEGNFQYNVECIVNVYK